MNKTQMSLGLQTKRISVGDNMDPKDKLLMAKAAGAIRQLEAENKMLRTKMGDLEKTASFAQGLSKQLESAQVVLRMVADGETDPEDALEKFAEVCSLSKPQVEELLRKQDVEKVGSIKGDSFYSEADPLVSFLLGTR